MTKKPYTLAEFRKFDYLTYMASSSNQMDRITGRMALGRLTVELGMEKCNAMWAEIERQKQERIKRDSNRQGITRSNRKRRRAAGKGR